jgi:hypothetical protein
MRLSAAAVLAGLALALGGCTGLGAGIGAFLGSSAGVALGTGVGIAAGVATIAGESTGTVANLDTLKADIKSGAAKKKAEAFVEHEGETIAADEVAKAKARVRAKLRRDAAAARAGALQWLADARAGLHRSEPRLALALTPPATLQAPPPSGEQIIVPIEKRPLLAARAEPPAAPKAAPSDVIRGLLWFMFAMLSCAAAVAAWLALNAGRKRRHRRRP